MIKITRFMLISLLFCFHSFPELKAQICSCNNYGPELITNGDFSQGNTGFSSAYLYSAAAGPGNYGISSTPWSANSYWGHCGDHTSGTGNLMWIDCAGIPENMWTETVNSLAANTDYFFSCWITTLDLNGSSTLQFSINGQQIGSSFTAPATTCNWVQFCFVWNSVNASSAAITITNQTTFTVGNDVALDDISFRVCCNALSNNQYVSICNGGSYQLPGGTTGTTTGTYYDTLSTYIGCDSIVITHLSVLSTSSYSQNISICNGQSYFAGGAFQTSAGTFFDTLLNYLGCDSVLTTDLTVLPNSAATINASICQGQTYFAGGALQTTSGIYSDILINYLGCDSVVTTNLTVLPNSAYTVNESICAGQFYFAGGALQNTSGIYYDTLVNYLGCDSILTTNLTVLPVSLVTVNASICNGQSYFVAGAFQNISGVYIDTFLNYFGCDSIVTSNLTVLPNSSFTQNVSICEGQSFYAGGAFQTQSGIYSDSILNAVGCDSVITTDLTVLPNSFFTQSISICLGDSILLSAAWQTQSGSYIDHYTNYLGCDSTLTTNLTVLLNSTFTVNASICAGQSYFAGGAFQTASGSYHDTLINYIGCDSVLITNLTVLLNSSVTVNASICNGQSYFAGGALQTTSGVYVDTFINYLGCDSIVTTNLTVLANTFFTQNVSICAGQSFYAGGAFQTQSGIYSDTILNASGCDSVVTTNLSVLSNSFFVQDISICFGDSIFLNTAWQTQNGSYTDHYTNYVGCDSTLTTILNVYPQINTQIAVTICNGQTYYAGGANQTQSGLYSDTLVAVSGCDSIVTTGLTVLQPISIHLYPSICEGEKYFAEGSWQTIAGIYLDTLSSYLGCDSAVITQLTVNPTPVIDLGSDTVFCEGSSIIIDAGNGYLSYVWQDQSTQSFYVANEMGSYWVKVTNSFGCSSSDTMQVTNVYPLPGGFLPTDTFICGNIPLTLEVEGFKNYLWSDGDTMSYHVFTQEGNSSLKVTDAHGCVATESVLISNACDNDILIPNAFTPNGDGKNDIFLPVLIKNLLDYHMVIFNRWGIKVFESFDPSTGWNGIDMGIPGEIGAYLWSLDYTTSDGIKKTIDGYVILLR